MLIAEFNTGEGPTDSGTLAELYSAPRAWYMLIIFVMQLLASGVDIAIVTLLVHPIETAFRINDVGFAAITAVPVALGTAVAVYPAGLLADTFRRRDLIAAGAVIWGFAALVAARADSEAMFFFARLLAGIGTAVPTPAIFSMLTDAFPRTRRAFAQSLYWAGGAIGVGVGLTICSALVEVTQRNGVLHIISISLLPWQQCFVAVAAIGLVILALVLTVPELPRRDRSTLKSASLRSSLGLLGQYLGRHGFLWILLFSGGAIGFMSYFDIAAWGPAFGMRHYGITGVSSIALLGTFLSGGSLLGSIVGGLLVQRGINHGDLRIVPRLLVADSLICCVFAAGFPSMPSWLLAVAGMGVVNGMSFAMSLLIVIGIQETASNEVRGQLMGLWNFVGSIPSIGAATLVAFLASGVFAKTGGLGPALSVVGGTTSALAFLLFAFSGNSYARARDEMRALAVPL